MPLNIDELAKQMLQAASASLKRDLPANGQAAQEFQKIAQLVQEIGEKFAAGEIDEDDARADLEAAELDTEDAVATEAGLGEIAAQDAVNAALDVVAVAVNKFVGFALI